MPSPANTRASSSIEAARNGAAGSSRHSRPAPRSAPGGARSGRRAGRGPAARCRSRRERTMMSGDRPASRPGRAGNRGQRRQHRIDAERGQRHHRRDQRDEFGETDRATNSHRVEARRGGIRSPCPSGRAGSALKMVSRNRRRGLGVTVLHQHFGGKVDEHLRYDQGRDLRIEHSSARAGAGSHAQCRRRGPAAARPPHLRRPN